MSDYRIVCRLDRKQDVWIAAVFHGSMDLAKRRGELGEPA
jgi:hypothetical protein